MATPYEIIPADIIVIGGAITGMFAAIRAKQLQPHSEVLVIDKGKASESGCARWGAGETTCVTPEDNIDKRLQHLISSGGGIADPNWIEIALRESYPRIQDMINWGVPFERDNKGELVRIPTRGGATMSAMSKGSTMLKSMRRQADSLGVKFIDKVMVTELMDDEHGEVVGGVGFRIGEDEVKSCVFPASATIMASGPCSFKAAFIGHRMVTGDGIAMAFRHGAELMGMEFAVSHNTGPRDFDIAGMARFVAIGGKFINGKGEEFMPRYDPVLGNKTTFDRLIFAMASEVRNGRGPIFFDMTGVAPAEMELSRKIVPFTFMALERMGIDPQKDRIEWIPCLAGNRSTGAGVRIKPDMSTSVPRLFAGGDTGGKYHFGAAAGYGGMNFSWCAISGYRAAESAVKIVRESHTIKASPDSISRALDYQLAPLSTSDGLTADEMIAAVQDAIVPYDISIIKHADRLSRALSNLQKRNSGIMCLRADNPHDLMKGHEAVNMATIAETILHASLVREESRGIHHREDFPERDDVNWKTWLYLNNDQGKIRLWVETEREKTFLE